MMAIVAGALLESAIALPASAAAMLTASENPVMFVSQQPPKSISISWNTGSNHKGDVKVSTSNGPWVDFASNQISGSKPWTVAYGKTYKFRLYDKNALLMTLDVTTKLQGPGSGGLVKSGILADLINTIKSVTITPHGTFAAFHVTTHKPTSFHIQVSTQDTLDSQGNFATVVGFPIINLAKQTDYSAKYMNLAPATLYHYIVRAKDAQGKYYKKTGAFTTLKRVVKVNFTKIEIVDDSDDLSEGDLGFGFCVHKSSPLSYSGGFDTGATFDPNAHFTIKDAPETMKLRVAGFDDDNVEVIPIGPFLMSTLNTCGMAAGCEAPSGDSDCDFEHAIGAKTIDVSGLAQGLTETEGDTFEMLVGGAGSDLKFKAEGNYQVSYAP